MKIIVLGSGHSGGTPMIGEGWGKADPNNRKNYRTRPSIIVEGKETKILIDTSPDLRLQLLAAKIDKIDAVLYTHSHADHLNGIDDLRAVNRTLNAWIPTYTDLGTWVEIEKRFGYVLEPLKGQGSFFYKPCLEKFVIDVDVQFVINEFTITAMDQDHGYTHSLGFRIGDFAYSTDVVDIPESTFQALKGINTWMVGALWENPHPTHAHIQKVLYWADRVEPKRLILTHLSHLIDYETVSKNLPSFATLAYDGMKLDIFE